MSKQEIRLRSAGNHFTFDDSEGYIVCMFDVRQLNNKDTGVSTLRVFICYCQRDAHFHKRLVDVYLKPLVKANAIVIWHDQLLLPSSRWEAEISEKLQTSDIILFLLSPDFAASDFIADKEIPMALALEESGQATLVPILIRRFDYIGHKLGTFTILPSNRIPVTSWKDQEDAFFDIEQGIKGAINYHRKHRRDLADDAHNKRAEDQPASVFLVAAQENSQDLALLIKHLRPFVSRDLFRVSDDRMLDLFGDYAENRRRAISAADLIVLLITSDLLSSDIFEEVLPKILARQQAEGVIVLALLVRSCNWEATDVRMLDTFIPQDRWFLAERIDVDQAFRETAHKIAEVVCEVVYRT